MNHKQINEIQINVETNISKLDVLNQYYLESEHFFSKLDMFKNHLDTLKEEIPASVLNLINCLQDLKHIGKIEKTKVDGITAKNLYSNFMKYYQPHLTSSDGNCVWNSVKILRKLTFLTLLAMKDDFLNLIKLDFEHSGIENGDVNLKFDDLLHRSKTNGSWGNEFHILALASFLNKNIYIYSAFKINGKFKLRKSIDESTLKANFHDIGLNLIYKPISNKRFISKKQVSNLFCFLRSKHYVSLIPVEGEVYIFPIKNNLFEAKS
jgi:hypothetical protein